VQWRWIIAPKRSGVQILEAAIRFSNDDFRTAVLQMRMEVDHAISPDAVAAAVASLIVAIAGILATFFSKNGKKGT